MSADPTPATGGLTEAEALAIAEAGYRRKVAWSRTAITPWSGLRDFQRDQQRIPAVEEAVERIIAARTEAADRDLARVTAAVEATIESLPDLTEGPQRAGTASWDRRDRDTYSLAIEEAQAALRAALSSADTTLDDLLDRERAKAAGEALREAAASMLTTATAIRDRSHWRATGWANWLRDRAAAVSPEDGGA